MLEVVEGSVSEPGSGAVGRAQRLGDGQEAKSPGRWLHACLFDREDGPGEAEQVLSVGGVG